MGLSIYLKGLLPSENAAPGEFLQTRTPVTIVTGFLGAGKTTLVNRILTAEHHQRVAVIVNEFGEEGIDHRLLMAAEEEIVQMNNGCLCCTVRGDLLRLLFQLADRKSTFDALLLETSGLADPTSVVQTLLLDDRIRSEFALNAIITLVDAKHAEHHLGTNSEVREQIALADTILLNKLDLVTADEMDHLEAKLTEMNPSATILRTRNAETDVSTLLHSRPFGLESKFKESPDIWREQHHHHTTSYSTLSLVENGEFHPEKLSQWIRTTLAECGDSILRMKGIFNLQGDPHQFVFHGVQQIYDGRPGREWNGTDERCNRLVLIGKELDGDNLRVGFRNCLATDGDSDPGRGTFTPSEEISTFTLDQIKIWLRQALEFPPEAPIIVKEVPCVKSGCPPVETAIIVLLEKEPPRFYKIQKTINEVTFDHIFNLIENPLPCC
ncbi:MAG: hypothetical protein GTO40_21045, partial [Deltaproteobacteria bacterium]|nr:hypothetical protein [Deltaproteobacteria bacterium]